MSSFAPEYALKHGLMYAVKEYERACILRAMKDAANNRTQAAKLLGLTRENLIMKLRKHNLKLDMPDRRKQS